MSDEAGMIGARRPAVAGAALVVAAGLIAGGCSSSGGSSSTLACPSKPGTAVTGTAPAATGRPAAGWAQPGADMANTRDVASAITSTDVSKLGVAWTVPLTMPAAHTDGAYATTPVIVNGVVYVQDLDSNVFAISLATGKVLWTHDYNSPNGGPDGVSVAGRVVYAVTSHAAVALNAATGAQLWSRTLTGNDHEGIDMAPGYNHGTVYVSTVPVNPTVGEYLGGGKGILWALNAQTGTPEWSWDQVQNLWGNPGINSGGGLWYPPSFDAQGNIYLGTANPGPIFGTTSYPLGSSRPGPDLYTDSVVKLSPAGKLLWYYQLTPHDLYDWDLQNSPVLSTANGRPVVIDGGKAGILIELDAQTGKLLWKLPVGAHDGHENDGLLTEHATPTSRAVLPAQFCLEPSSYGGIVTQLASNGSTTFAAVNDLALPGDPGRLHRVGGRHIPGHREGHRRDGRGQPGHRHRRVGHPAAVHAVRRCDGNQRHRAHHHLPRRPVRARRGHRRHLVQDADVRREQRASRRRRRLHHRQRRRRAVQDATGHDHRLQARGHRQAPRYCGLIT